MSVTFAIEANPTGEHVVLCPARDVEVARTSSYDEATGALSIEHEHACEDCSVYGATVRAVMDVDVDGVNLSNPNAGMLLGILGIDVADPSDLWGAMPGEQFLGHVLVALAEDRDDTGVAAAVDARPGRATWIDCGLRPGYLGMRLRELHDFAQEAARLGRDITWG